MTVHKDAKLNRAKCLLVCKSGKFKFIELLMQWKSGRLSSIFSQLSTNQCKHLLRFGMLVEDNLRCKTTFRTRQPLVEDNLWWKTTFGGRGPSVEDDLRRMTTFGGRWPSGEDDLRWKTTFSGRWPSVEDALRWKTTFSGRRSLLNPCMLPAPLCGIFFATKQRKNTGRPQKSCFPSPRVITGTFQYKLQLIQDFDCNSTMKTELSIVKPSFQRKNNST